MDIKSEKLEILENRPLLVLIVKLEIMFIRAKRHWKQATTH